MTGRSTAKPLEPGACIGIVGGGQLARMSALAARAMGFRIAVADPDPDCPAAGVADVVVSATLGDPEGVAQLAEHASVITYEFENISPSVLERLAQQVPVVPPVRVLQVSQNRILEKSTLQQMGVPVGPWRAVHTRSDFDAALADIGYPSVLKTATEGYDGKGQVVIRAREDADTAFEGLAGAGRSLVLEAWVLFEREISVVVARGCSGEAVAFPVAENIHRENILSTSIVPARVPDATATEAVRLAVRIATELDLVGVLGVEMFVLTGGQLLVNELAPRPHNSGHYTQDACVTSQFEQHIRAVAGLPLGSVALLCPVVMVNVMGEDYPLDLTAILRDSNAKLHLYGKSEARPKRKMGHINVLGAEQSDVLERAALLQTRMGR